MKINPNEEFVEFIKRFNKLSNSLLVEIKPSLIEAKVVYVGAFKSDFSFTLRERRSPTMD